MSPENLCYWLQGYFELSLDKTYHINADMAEVILAHLDLVEESSETNNFCAWLRGVLEFMRLSNNCALDDKTTFEINSNVTYMIRDKLANEFAHVIDKKYRDDKDKLQKIHDGRMNDIVEFPTHHPLVPDHGLGGPKYMC